MIIIVDIDKTLCIESPTTEAGPDYSKAQPIPVNIAKVNRAYDTGHTIILWTGRGGTTGIDWGEITEKQLRSWGVKYHELKFKKIYYDLWIDDKALTIEDWEI